MPIRFFRLVLPIVFAVAAIAVFLTRLAVTSQRLPAVTGAAGMVGGVGRALTVIAPGEPGRVATHGEIWTAVAIEPIAEGDLVSIEDLQGLRLTVAKRRSG